MTSRQPTDYGAYGLVIRSEVELPALPTVTGRPAADVTIRLGREAAELSRAPRAEHIFRIDANTHAIEIRDLARFVVRDGREIIVEPVASASALNVRAFVMGSAFGMLFHQRGLLPLHACVVRMNAHAIAFAGESGAGKSTLAAYFHSQGYDILSDDVCVVGFESAGRPMVWPGVPGLKLWRDSTEFFGKDSAALEVIFEGVAKHHLPTTPLPNEPLPLAKICVLNTCAQRRDREAMRLTGSTALDAVMRHTYRPHFLQLMLDSQGAFRRNILLLKSVPVFQVSRQWGFDMFHDEAAKLEHYVLQAEPSSLA